MPLVRISLHAGKPANYRRAVGDAVHRALVEAVNVPPGDRFQIITEHDADGLIVSPDYLGIERTGGIVMIQTAFNAGRTVGQKRALYAKIAARLRESPGVCPQDVWVRSGARGEHLRRAPGVYRARRDALTKRRASTSARASSARFSTASHEASARTWTRRPSSS
jgi:hypothetical protein